MAVKTISMPMSGRVYTVCERASDKLQYPFSSRKRWKECRCHLCREFLEHAHRPRDVAVAEMDHPEMEDGEAPYRHDLDEPAVAQQLRLHQRRKVADAGARQQRGRKAGVVVHREERLERQHLLFLSVRMSEVPVTQGRPKRKRE